MTGRQLGRSVRTEVLTRRVRLTVVVDERDRFVLARRGGHARPLVSARAVAKFVEQEGLGGLEQTTLEWDDRYDAWVAAGRPRHGFDLEGRDAATRDEEPDIDDEPPPDVGPPGSGAIVTEYHGHEFEDQS